MANEIVYGPAAGPPGPPGPAGPVGSAASGGRVFYLSDQGGIAPDYESLDIVPDTAAEDTMVATGIVASDGEVELLGPAAPSAWVTPEGVPGVAAIDAGAWEIKLFADADVGDGASYIVARLYSTPSDVSSETLLFEWDVSPALGAGTPDAPEALSTVQPSFGTDPSSRLVLRLWAKTDSTVPVNVRLYHGGSSRYTRVVTPLVAVPAISTELPEPLGVANTGNTLSVSAGNHVHEHGELGGGALHAAATGGAAGFMAGEDKTKLDSIVVASIPSADEKAALAGTSGAPGADNRYVTASDVVNTNARVPTPHALSHAGGGSDAIDPAVANGASGLMTGVDKAKLDTVESGAQVVTVTRVTNALAAAVSSVSFNGQRLTSVGSPGASTDADTVGARDAAIAAALSSSEAVAGSTPATTAQTTIDVTFSYRVVSNAVVEIAAYDMPATGASVAIFADMQAFTEGTHANQMVHVIVGSGKRTSGGASSRTSPAAGGGSGQVVNDFAVTRPALSVSDPSSAVAPNVQHRLAVLYTGKSGVNTIVTGTARIVIGRVT